MMKITITKTDYDTNVAHIKAYNKVSECVYTDEIQAEAALARILSESINKQLSPFLHDSQDFDKCTLLHGSVAFHDKGLPSRPDYKLSLLPEVCNSMQRLLDLHVCLTSAPLFSIDGGRMISYIPKNRYLSVSLQIFGRSFVLLDDDLLNFAEFVPFEDSDLNFVNFSPSE